MANILGLSRNVKITVLKPNQFGNLEGEVIYSKKKKAKKELRGLGPIQKVARRLVKSEKKFITNYLEKHDKSRTKKRSGWVKDFSYNILKSQQKAVKSIWK